MFSKVHFSTTKIQGYLQVWNTAIRTLANVGAYIWYRDKPIQAKQASGILSITEAHEDFSRNSIPEMQPDDSSATTDKTYKIPSRFVLAENLCRNYSERIETYFEQKKPYLDPELTMQKVAAELNMPLHHLSMVLNECIGYSFTDYVNRYRIEEVKRKLTEMQYLKIESIGYEAGFNSKATFNRVFKKHCRQSPSEYQKALRIPVST
ncbi:AraC family transcriptional regulator [Rhodocytophaga rosea]|uniref:AraC family transcriptional regulator n=1 Tax=Rhodocytophaga rosea TaxID=2704465 RepID=A0A6C0GJ81_9BACT|nr:helix-turn-helix domain-containing protein [Rhodocytophaga rosea]QHT67743.1 AraC family transcriptional regulator [Rhodocytophaga rosea]